MADPVWTDGVTPLNAVNMTKLQTRDEKAAANGYASLDSGGKVPAAQLPTVSGDNLHYLGDWAAGSFVEGDIVVKNGVLYMATKPTSQDPATPWPGGPSAAYAAPSYGTSLPTTPTDGQEAILVDSLTNPTYQWRFRYNAGSTSAYKWEYIGGTPAWKRTDTQEGTASSSAQDLNTIDNIIVPRGGDYDCDWGCEAFPNTANDNQFVQYLFCAGTQMQLVGSWCYGVAQWSGSVTKSCRLLAIAASSDIRTRYASPTGRQTNFVRRWLKVTPVRVA